PTARHPAGSPLRTVGGGGGGGGPAAGVVERTPHPDARERRDEPAHVEVDQASRTARYRKSRAKDQTALRVRIRELAHARPRFDYGRLRDGCLNVHQFVSLEDAREKIEAWRLDYNQQRPHSALGHLTPSEFVTHRQEARTRKWRLALAPSCSLTGSTSTDSKVQRPVRLGFGDP